MIDSTWAHIFQRIPPDYYDCLALITITGAELVVQQIYRFERDFMIVRARTSGTMDGARVLIVPYAQIDFVGFNRKMLEEEVQAVFGAPMPALPSVPVPIVDVSPATVATFQPVIPVTAPSSPTPLPSASTVTISSAEPSVPGSPALKAGQISKTILLARLRERLAEKAK